MIVKPEESAPPSVASTSKAQLHDEPLESEASLAAAEEQAGIALEFMALGRLRPVEASSEAQVSLPVPQVGKVVLLNLF